MAGEPDAHVYQGRHMDSAFLEALAQALLEKETLDSTEINRILDSFPNLDESPEIPAQLPLGLQQA